MAQFQFKKAERKGIFGRIALDGPTGSGKSYTALTLATALANGKRIAVIDTEHSSADRYADIFDFDKVNLETFSPDTYVEAINSVDPEVYGVLVIDSLSHAWAGKEGALEQVDKAAARSQSGNKFTAWRDVTPMHNRLVDAMLGVQCHLIVTMRSKMEYILVENEKGKKEPKRVGMAPIQRDGMEYELDIVADMDNENRLIVTKTRASFLAGAVISKPTGELGLRILEWCGHVEPKPTLEDLKALAAFAAEKGKTPDDVKAIGMKCFGRSVRDLSLEEINFLKEQISGVV